MICVDPARYLLIRLCLCKRGKWHTLGSLERYKFEIGGKQNISNAIDELCGIAPAAPEFVKKEEPDVIDLTMDEDEDAHDTVPHTSTSISPLKQEKDNAVASLPNPNANAELSEAAFSDFAIDDTKASVPELLTCLSMDELKLVGKQMKVTKTGQNVGLCFL